MSRLAVIGGGQMGEGPIVSPVNGGLAAGDITVVEPNQARAKAVSDALGVPDGGARRRRA
jgi:pyrroline-5-carboxylate reductase